MLRRGWGPGRENAQPFRTAVDTLTASGARSDPEREYHATATVLTTLPADRGGQPGRPLIDRRPIVPIWNASALLAPSLSRRAPRGEP